MFGRVELDVATCGSVGIVARLQGREGCCERSGRKRSKVEGRSEESKCSAQSAVQFAWPITSRIFREASPYRSSCFTWPGSASILQLSILRIRIIRVTVDIL